MNHWSGNGLKGWRVVGDRTGRINDRVVRCGVVAFVEVGDTTGARWLRQKCAKSPSA